MAKPAVLDLDSLFGIPTVVVAGTSYEMRNILGTNLRDFHKLGKQAARAAALQENVAALDEAGVEELATLLDQLCRYVLKAPEAVHEALTDDQRVKIVEFFLKLRQEMQAPTAGAEPAPETPEASQ